jgi:GT2 family glycosyltransferase
MSQSLKTAAIFATMNRARTAVTCVRALAAQTRPPDLVVVADNVSTDGTAAALESLTDMPFPLVVLRMRENRGNAGGVEEAMELAFARGADAVWILDDDSWPRPEALSALLARPWNPSVVRHALQIDPQSGKFTWPLWVECDGGWRLAFDETELPGGEWIRSKASWTGSLISKHVRDAVGPVHGALFIRGEDEEYPWRIARAGFRFEAARGAVMDHPGAPDLVHWRMFGKNFFFERGLVDWKLYYKARNMVWLERKRAGGLKAIATGLAYAAAVAFIDGPARLPLVWTAAWDGWAGKLGKWSRHGVGR